MNNSIVVGVLESENTIRNAITARFGSAVDVISCRDVNEWMEMLGSHQLSLIIAERHTAFTNAFLLLGLTKEAGLDCPFWLVAQQVSDSDDALLSLAGVAKRISINEIDHALLAISTLLTGGDAIESIETELVTGLFEWNLADQHTYFSPSCLSIWGRETDTEAANIEFWWACISDLDKQFVKAKFDALLSSGESNMVVEHRLNAELGMTRWCRVAIKSIKDSHGKVQVIEGTVSDITAERAAQKDLISRALSDPSGLANNTFFNAQLERVLTASKSSRAGLSAVVFFNISRL